MTDNSPRAVVLRATDLFDGTLAGTDRYLEMFADSAVWEFAPTAESPRWSRVEGKKAARALYQRVYDQRSDVSSTIHEVVTEGDTVVVTYTYSGTVSADVPGFPAGSRRNFEAVNLYTVSDGLIVRYVQYTGSPVLAEPPEEALP
ncbi:MAG: nuclear transport factor 2 family protein [Dehalococcoidia bacterium]|nr:nuclear transport factor 2 family protein [Chloroflexi bacterium CFX7]MCK6565589.1 nuclear transport factor 2 family protein [Dehalococcoidia bacterium]NUQ54801.1 nuclear transport factor 2 family protein [Dehalococcoidia bacterium]